MSSPPLFRLSQGQLNLLTTCPRKFQHVYLEQLSTPLKPEQQEHLAWVSQFHLLMQQRELGLPIEQLLAADSRLQQCLDALMQSAPEVLNPDPSDLLRQSEHRRTLEFQGYLLTVIYDLIILRSPQAEILDWKTYPRPQDPTRLARDWQTRLYLFVLAETSDYLPEQISMTYWFVPAPNSRAAVTTPQSLRLPYGSIEHEQTRQDLTQLLHQLTLWLQAYEQGEDLPQVEESTGLCSSCQFDTRCQRGNNHANADLEAWLPDLQSIPEIAL